MFTRRCVCCEEIFEAPDRSPGNGLQSPIDYLWDAGERDAFGEEGLDSHLVRGVQDARRRPPDLPGLAGQAKAGEGVGVRLLG